MLRTLPCLLLLALSSFCGTAHAEPVLMACSNDCSPALFEALELELRGHGGVLVARPGLSGLTPETRAADARRLTELLDVGTTLWVEAEPPQRVRAYSRRTGEIREAPLEQPLSQVEPRVFAAVAGSVVLEALAAPGHAAPVALTSDVAAAQTPPKGPEVSTTRAAVGPMQPISDAARSKWPAPSKVEQWRRRFFVRGGAALGLARLHSGVAADGPPSAALVNRALEQQQMTGGDPETGRAFLKAHGYDCSWSQTMIPNGAQGFLSSHCKVAVKVPGRIFLPAVDLATGANVTARLALALTARITPHAGRGRLAHALFGLQAEWQLTEPKPRGFWTSAALGLGFGRIEARPASGGSGGPYASSGLNNVRGGFLLGYRFAPRVGLVAAPLLHFMFPDKFWVFDTAFNLEVRI